MGTGTRVRAIHRDGVLELLTPLELPEGAQVSVIVLETPTDEANQPHVVELAYPTRLVPAKKLDALTDLVAVGGDALADSEALYD
jgi:predicted DNA-binding antitoxin AbrB/MazE fold protein